VNSNAQVINALARNGHFRGARVGTLGCRRPAKRRRSSRESKAEGERWRPGAASKPVKLQSPARATVCSHPPGGGAASNGPDGRQSPLSRLSAKCSKPTGERLYRKQPRRIYPSSTRTLCVAPSSTRGICATPEYCSPSSSVHSTRRETPVGFSTRIS
jgi:hypothetical protein